MPALSTFITSVTQDKFIPKVIDNVLSGNVLAMRLLTNARTWNGGHQIVQPVNLSSYTQLGSYSGFDTFSTTQQNTRQKATFDPSQVYCSISISGIQQAVNKGESAVIDVIAAEMEQRANDLKDEMGTQLYSDGTGNSAKDIVGLQAAVDDATSITTYGGLSRSTYTNWKATRTAQSGSLALSDLSADFDAAQIGDDAPSLIVTTPAVFTLYEALLTPTVRHNLSFNAPARLTAGGVQAPQAGQAAGQGFTALFFRGRPVVADEKCTAQNIYTLNEKHLFVYKIPHATHPTHRSGFAWTGWKEPVNQDAVTGQLLWYGQLLCDAPRTQARRTGVSS